MQAAALWQEAPAVTRCVVATHISLSLLIPLVPTLGLFFSLSVEAVSYGIVFPVVTNFLGGSIGGNPAMAVLMILFSTVMALSYFPALEREYGSMRFMAWLALACASISLPFLAVTYLFSWYNPAWRGEACNGLWPLMLLALTKNCLLEPQREMSFWGLVKVPSRYYPFVLLAFFTVLSMRLQVSILMAVLAGVAASNSEAGAAIKGLAWLRLPLSRALPSPDLASWVEQGADAGQRLAGSVPIQEQARVNCAKAMSALGRRFPACVRKVYIAASDRGQRKSEGEDDSRSALPKVVAAPGRNDVSAARFVPFQGSGHRLGDNEQP